MALPYPHCPNSPRQTFLHLPVAQQRQVSRAARHLPAPVRYRGDPGLGGRRPRHPQLRQGDSRELKADGDLGLTEPVCFSRLQMSTWLSAASIRVASDARSGKSALTKRRKYPRGQGTATFRRQVIEPTRRSGDNLRRVELPRKDAGKNIIENNGFSGQTVREYLV